VGDVASPLRDPALDYLTGAWIGGRVDSMDTLLKIANEQTRIVPAYGPTMSKAEFKTERDMMEQVRDRLFKQVREGDGPKDMLEAGVLKGLPRTWKDPYKFLYDAAKGFVGASRQAGSQCCLSVSFLAVIYMTAAVAPALRSDTEAFSRRSHPIRKSQSSARENSHRRNGCE
jgi:hypothetical protein